MGSGMFPISKESEEGRKLLEARKLIFSIHQDNWDYVLSGDTGGNQFDNAAIDGKYMGKLELMVKLIDECLREGER